MNATDPIDTARLSLALGDLRLPAIKVIWPDFADRADKEGWPAARFLAALTEHEIAERSRRRIERHLDEARLPPGKTLESFEFEAVPMVSKAQVMALVAGDSWLEKGANLILFGPAKLDKYHLLILDDFAYVAKDQAETSVLFELIGTRYERRSLLITANQPFGDWGGIFPNQAMTLAAIDRLVHHATIFEMNVESYRRRVALERKRGPGRPASRATINANMIDAARQDT